MAKLGCHQMDFPGISYWGLTLKSVKRIEVCLILAHVSGTLLEERICYDNILVNSSAKEKSYRKSEMHISCHIHFFGESCCK
jgi:hypothetical protein